LPIRFVGINFDGANANALGSNSPACQIVKHWWTLALGLLVFGPE